MPSSGISRDALLSISASSFSRPSLGRLVRTTSSRSCSISSSSSTSTLQSPERTISSSSVPETISRTTESIMSSRRLRPPRSSRTLRKNCRGSTIRQRAVVSTWINSRPRVGIWVTSPSQTSRRLSKKRTSCQGSLKCRPGWSTTSPMGSPNCTMMACCASSRRYRDMLAAMTTSTAMTAAVMDFILLPPGRGRRSG